MFHSCLWACSFLIWALWITQLRIFLYTSQFTLKVINRHLKMSKCELKVKRDFLKGIFRSCTFSLLWEMHSQSWGEMRKALLLSLSILLLAFCELHKCPSQGNSGPENRFFPKVWVKLIASGSRTAMLWFASGRPRESELTLLSFNVFYAKFKRE